ncbi:hypothetical protein TanjilG_16785 [Lupinus angustifolius]|uniref:TPX2 C-terminal domain-containing protein n=1 Tax=Lupinus angustifolius TaxID=3871 RepID=A0A4P1QZR0_LUPAN|nr:hypothetical protein TanjilG_16785 [Lupinus angustifolius]
MPMLGESISFGRFMSESLDWERWSTFTQKRYVEEAEKYSKPGSVAAKRAYFEAHYKRKAQEKTAILTQEANAHANGTSDSETWEGNNDGRSVEKKSKADNIMEHSAKDAVSFQVVVDTNQCKLDVGQTDLDISDVEGVAEDMAQTCVDTSLNVENQVLDDNPNKEIAVVPVEERIPDPGPDSHEIFALPVKGTEVNSSTKLSTKTAMANPSHSLHKRKDIAALPRLKSGTIVKKSDISSFEKTGLTARSPHMSINLPSGTSKRNKTASAAEQSRNDINGVLKSKKSNRNPFEKKGLATQSLHMSISIPSGTAKRNKTVAAVEQSRNSVSRVLISKKSVGGSIEMKGLTALSLNMPANLPSGAGKTSKTATAADKPRNGINRASKIMKVEGESVEKRPTSRSLHMSINLSSSAGFTSKTLKSPVFEQNRSKKLDSSMLSVSNHHPMASLPKASHGFLNQASANPPSQCRRSERLLNKSVSGGVASNAKFSSISAEFSKSSSTIKSNLRPLTTSTIKGLTSFSISIFQFSQRADETKSNEEEKLQRIPKVKTDHDHKKQQQISGGKSKLREDAYGGSQCPNKQIRKDKNLGNSCKPPIHTNSTKHVAEKNKRATRQSATSLSNMTRENASPNIQH